LKIIYLAAQAYLTEILSMTMHKDKLKIICRHVPMFLLLCCLLTSCQTVKPTKAYSTLIQMQEWTTPAPQDRVLMPREERRAKLAMAQWLDKHLNDDYEIIDQHFAFTTPEFADRVSIDSKARQHFEDKRRKVEAVETEYDDSDYIFLLWDLDDTQPCIIAIVIARYASPEMREAHLVGYFEVEMPRIIVAGEQE
jgi:hypothetical protein